VGLQELHPLFGRELDQFGFELRADDDRLG
jgi:hypothetical protein